MLVSEEKFLCFKDVLSILVIRWRFVSTPKIQKENIMGGGSAFERASYLLPLTTNKISLSSKLVVFFYVEYYSQ